MSSISIPSYVWGPGGWKLLEGMFLFGSKFQNTPGNLINEDPSYRFLIYLATHLPGSACKIALSKYLNENIPSAHEDRGEWLVRLHNEVNRRTKKPEISISTARQLVWNGDRRSLTPGDKQNIRKFLSVARFESYHKETEMAMAIGNVFDWIALVNTSFREESGRASLSSRFAPEKMARRTQGNSFRLRSIYAHPETYDIALIFSNDEIVYFDALKQQINGLPSTQKLPSGMIGSTIGPNNIYSNFAQTVRLQVNPQNTNYMQLIINTTQKLSCVLGGGGLNVAENKCGPITSCQRFLSIGPISNFHSAQLFIDPTYPLPHVCVLNNNTIHILLLPLCESVTNDQYTVKCETVALEKFVNDWISVSI